MADKTCTGPAQFASGKCSERGEQINLKVKMCKSLHLRLLQQIVYFSLMILAIIMRRIVERFLGFKIGQIHADKNMVAQGREGWVSFLA